MENSKILKLFLNYISPVEFNGEEVIADCIFCGKSEKLYIHTEKGLWQCKVCNKEGDKVDFLKAMYVKMQKGTSDEDLIPLKKKRLLSIHTLKRFGIVHYEDKYVIPIFDHNNEVINLRTYNYKSKGAKLLNSPTIPSNLYNVAELTAEDKYSFPVYITEGEWDCIALDSLIRRANIDAIVVALPGVKSFKKEWSPLFLERNIIICTDNDDAGDDGAKRTAGFLEETTKSIRYLNLPYELKKGYDVSDFIRDNGVKTKDFKGCYQKLYNICLKSPRTAKVKIAADSDDTELLSFSELVSKTKEVIELNEEYELAYEIILACAISIRLFKMNPLWIYLVGPPGCGKTTILNLLSNSDLTIFQSSVTPTSLVSGFAGTKVDPSLMFHANNHCLILKDWTEILSKHENERQQISSILRGAYDGDCHRTFGNGQRRNIKTNFTLLAGVTNKIYGDSDAELGERFLKFAFRTKGLNIEKQQYAAMRNALGQDLELHEVQLYISTFLQRELEYTREDLEGMIPEWFRPRLMALATLIAWLRTPVDRFKGYHRLSDEVIYDPEAEIGSRLVVQFQNLGLILAINRNLATITEEIYDKIKRVAFDTSLSKQLLAVKFIINNNGKVKADDLKNNLKVRDINTFMSDLIVLQIVHKHIKDKIVTYTISKRIKQLWEKCKL